MRHAEVLTGLKLSLLLQITNESGSICVICMPVVGPFMSTKEAQQWWDDFAHEATENPERYPGEGRRLVGPGLFSYSSTGPTPSADLQIGSPQTVTFASAFEFDIDTQQYTIEEAADQLLDIASMHIKKVLD